VALPISASQVAKIIGARLKQAFKRMIAHIRKSTYIRHVCVHKKKALKPGIEKVPAFSREAQAIPRERITSFNLHILVLALC
jgi:abortive infection bacteriophage resistance protein